MSVNRLRDCKLESLDIKSTEGAHRNAESKDVCLQTESVEYLSRRVLANLSRHAEVDVREERIIEEALGVRGERILLSKEETLKLGKFLERVEPLLIDQLRECPLSNNIFSSYCPRWEEDNCSSVQTILEIPAPVISEEDISEDSLLPSSKTARYSVAATSFNANCSCLAVSYRHDEGDWLFGKNTNVVVYRISLLHHRTSSSSTACSTARTSAANNLCICQDIVDPYATQLAFHPSPKNPSTLAIGCYDGRIRIWDIASTAPERFTSPVEDYCHRDSIRQLQWVSTPPTLDDGTNEEIYYLCSLCNFGVLLFWSLKHSLIFPFRTVAFTSVARPYFGGMSFSFSKLDWSLFAVGSEAGILLRGFLKTPPAMTTGHVPGSNLLWEKDALEVIRYVPPANRACIISHVEQYVSSTTTQGGGITKTSSVTGQDIFRSKPPNQKLAETPRVAELERSSGPVTYVSFSPHLRKILMASNMNGEIKIFDVLRSQALFVFSASADGVRDAIWSPTLPLVFTAATINGGLLSYDLRKRDDHRESIAVSLKATCHCIPPNNNAGIVAVGCSSDDQARVIVLRLPNNVCAPKVSEKAEQQRAIEIFKQEYN